MKRIGMFVFLMIGYFPLFAQQMDARPKIVVGIVVDQMRWDYVYRFYERYGNGGFKRLLQEGFSCANTRINYMPSYTAPGHACVYTGSVPSIHGIAGNDWTDNLTGRRWYCTEDTSVSSLGGSRDAGKMSPRNLLASTITDELRLATNFKSRVFGISIKDRGAIIPAGHLANGAFWYDDSTGNFISSSYYSASLPPWLVRFNARRLSDSFLRQGWTTLYPLNTYRQSLDDDNPYEGKFAGENSPTFPHLKNASVKYANLRRIPAGNEYTLAAAKACMEGEELGQKNATDFLCISFSATDYVGHQFSPNSVEVEDMYLRLDKNISQFLSYLDRKIGKGNYLLFLTADHGGAHNAHFLNDIKIPAGNEHEIAAGRALNAYLKKVFGKDSLIRGFENYQVFLNDEQIRKVKVGRRKLKNRIIQYFYKKPQVTYVVDMENMDRTALPEPVRTMAINGYNRLRSGQILVINNPGWYYGYAPTGTTHGTWHPYDTHIPLLWYGWGIKNGKTHRTVHMEDIAPTLAALLRIQMPNGCVGNVIGEVVE